MATPLLGRVAIVTGGSKGIGRATARTLAAAGAFVVINYASDVQSGTEAVREIGSDRALAIQADASTLQGAGAIVDATIERFGRLDILVLNAGMLYLSGVRACTTGLTILMHEAMLHMLDLAGTSEKDFDDAFRMNVKGPYFVAQKAAPHMKHGGRIIFLSTTQCAASTVTGNYLLYCSTKGAIEQITRVLSKDLAQRGVLVNAIAPGPTGTEMFLQGKSKELVDTIASWNPHVSIAPAFSIKLHQLTSNR